MANGATEETAVRVCVGVVVEVFQVDNRTKGQKKEETDDDVLNKKRKRKGKKVG